MRLIPLLLPPLVFLPLVAVSAGDAPLDRATLRGLKAVSVVLDPLAPELERQGLTQKDLQTRLEARLKDARIPIDPSATAFLGLRVTSVRANRGPFALCFSVGAFQSVVLVRDKNIQTNTSTWEVETVVMADPKVLHQASLESVDELAGRFITAWRSVNQQGTAPTEAPK